MVLTRSFWKTKTEEEEKRMPFEPGLPEAGKSYTGEGSASFKKLGKPVWRPKRSQLIKFRRMLCTIMQTKWCISLSCLPFGLQSYFQAIWSFPLYKISLPEESEPSQKNLALDSPSVKLYYLSLWLALFHGGIEKVSLKPRSLGLTSVQASYEVERAFLRKWAS